MTAQLSPLRRDRVTASRVAAILGVGKYGDRAQVLRDMVRDHFHAPADFLGNVATEWGNLHEDDARTAYEQSRGVMVLDAQEFVPHPEYSWIGVSPDGLVGTDALVEIKCPYRARYTSIAEVPHYWVQIQLQLACTQREWCDFVIWRSFVQADRWGVDPLIVERVEADPTWLPGVLPLLEEFYAEYEAIIADPERAAEYLDDAEPPIPDGWGDTAARWLELDEQIKTLTAERDEAKAALLELAGDRSVKAAGVQVIRAERVGAVDYAAVVAKHLPDVDVDGFRKAGSVVFTVKALKEN